MANNDTEYAKVIKMLKELDETKDSDRVAKLEARLARLRDKLSAAMPDRAPEAGSYVPYPDITSARFYEDLLAKKEFRENRYPPFSNDDNKTFDDFAREKCSSGGFDLTPNQSLMKTFMSPQTPYNGILLFHGVGVGKTCTAINVAEQYLGEENRRKVLVLMPSSLLRENFRKQIYDASKQPKLQCMGSKYAAMVPARNLMTPDAVDRKVNKIVNGRYKFMGFLEFANEIERIRKDVGTTEDDDDDNVRFHRKLAAEFSDHVIIIDEVHNMRLDSEVTKKRVPPMLELVLKKAQNVKLVLMTATPMFNDPREIVYIINLLLHNDKRTPLAINDFFDKRGNLLSGEPTQRLKEVLRGYVSYMRGDNPFSFPFRLYPSINDDEALMTPDDVPEKDIKGEDIAEEDQLNSESMPIVLTDFEKPQRKLYQNAEKNFSGAARTDPEADPETTFSMQVCIQLSNITYPVSDNHKHCFGENGFWACFDRIKGRTFAVEYRDGHDDLLAPDNVSSVSCKIASILEYVRKSRGIVFVYSNWKWSGVLPLAIALEHAGFSKYGGRNILHGAGRKRNAGNYIVLSGDKDMSPDNDGEIQVVKASNNINGEVVKVVLATSVATEGIDFKCIREIHLLEPWFHMNKVEQIIGRAVRNCSHMALDSRYRNVTIYQHAATLRKERESIDLRMYRISYAKQRRIRKVERLMQNVSVDCALNKPVLDLTPETLNLQIPIETSQGMYIKDYAVGDKSKGIKCITELPAREDTSTFTAAFYADGVSKFIDHVAAMFRDVRAATYDQVLVHLKTQPIKVNEEVLRMALQHMVTHKDPVRDANMVDGYIIYASDKYIFHPTSTRSTRLSLSARLQKRTDTRPGRVSVKDETEREWDVDHSLVIFKRAIVAMRKTMNLSEGKYRDQSVDFVVDRLTKEQYLDLCLLAWDGKHKDSRIQDFVSSLERGNLIVRSSQGKTLKFVVCPFNSTSVFYTRGADGRMREMTELESKENKELLNAARPTELGKMKSYTAYMMNTDDGKQKFKILQEEKESMGYVCEQTATLKVTTLKEMIDGLDESLVGAATTVRNKLPDKKGLCQLYELALRARGRFARPHIVNLILSDGGVKAARKRRPSAIKK